ncbi:MAG: helix-turn-helix transcriptional regulator [Dehalococcoidia bacterium]|nr:helix-turn-helix transcriptional regulator [Dehalococcoidia bacterium]
MNTVGKNIQHFRKRHGLSQEDMATELHVTRQAVSNWETGKAFPDIDMLKRIATFIEVSVNDIIYDAAERKSKRIIHSVSVKPVLYTPIAFFLLTFLGYMVYGPLFERTFGGGVAETFLYPLYFGQIILATLLVLCTCIVVDEIRRHSSNDD